MTINTVKKLWQAAPVRVSHLFVEFNEFERLYIVEAVLNQAADSGDTRIEYHIKAIKNKMGNVTPVSVTWVGIIGEKHGAHTRFDPTSEGDVAQYIKLEEELTRLLKEL